MPEISPSNTPSNALTWDMVTNAMPMVDDPTKVASESQVYKGDLALFGLINAKPITRYYENGAFKNGSPLTGDIIVFTDSVTTSGGSATFYATSDHLSTGTALCSYISGDSLQPNYRDSSGVYTPGTVTVAGNLKSISQAFGKQSFAGLVVLGLNVLGSASNPAIPDGVTIKSTWWGIAA